VASPSALERRLGPLDAAAIIVSNVIGGGILFTPPQVAASVPSPWWFLSTWAVGGALAFAGAMAYAELAALRPRAGGDLLAFASEPGVDRRLTRRRFGRARDSFIWSSA